MTLQTVWLCLCICFLFLLAIIGVLFKIPLQLITLLLFIIGILLLVLAYIIWKHNYKERRFEHQLNRIIKHAKKTNDRSILYNAMETILLPNMRQQLPVKIYKYYQLSEDDRSNQLKFDALKKRSIWSSTAAGFNDPFECQYIYLTEEDILSMGFQKETKFFWDFMTAEINNRITTICFTQNPNNMPMWAHYANNHQGFCVEYQIDNTSHFYPVWYVSKRLKTKALLGDLVTAFLGDGSQGSTDVLKAMMLLSSFKEKGWESEKEIRAIFINNQENISHNGRLCTWEEIGVHPTKLFIGVKCSPENEKKLVSIAENLGIEWQKCELSSNEKFSVVS